MSHTPKTTIQCPVCDREDWDISPAIQARYDGCVGLNPAAYRECVEAIRTTRNILTDIKAGRELTEELLQHGIRDLTRVLALAEAQP
mgnify:FL=1